MTIPSGLRLGVALGAVLSAVLAGGAAHAGVADPVPLRPARQLPPVSWSAFRNVFEDSLPENPIRSAILTSRWVGLARSLGGGTAAASPADTPVIREREVSVAEASRPGESGLELPGESPEFRAALEAALVRAREDDAAGCRSALSGAAPRTLAGETAANRLRFAAAVAAGDREEAEGLSYRLIESDGGRRAARLDSWRRLEAGEGSGVVSVLGGLIDATPGERAAAAVGRWQAGFRGAGAPGEEWMEVEGLSRVAMALAAGAQAAAMGDMDGAARPLLGLRGASVPEPWRPAFDALSEPGGSSDPSRDDVAAYREAAELFLDGRDEAARDRLSGFLAQWPTSTHRPLAYLLRAQLGLAAGRPTDAEADLQAAERLAGPAEVVDRARVLRAFLLARGGRSREALADLDAVMAGGLGARAEGELRFDRIRLLRLAGDGPSAEAGILELEEAFPGEPWARRAREDGRAEAWREPWRSLPPEPQARREIQAPTEGPWGLLLWGEFVLSREAEAVSGVGSGPSTAAVSSDSPLFEEPTPPSAPVVAPPSGRLAYLEAGLGGPIYGSLGAGVAGSVAGFLYRAEAGQLLAQKRNDLPRSRRTDWELAGARLSGPVRFGAALEGTGRTDDDAADLGLNPDEVDTYAWAGRLDLTSGDLGRTGFLASVSRLSGDIDAGASGTWKSRETWLELRGSAAMETQRWEGQYTYASFSHDQIGFDETHGLHDLRVVSAQPAGWYLGGRAAVYRDRGLILPVGGARVMVGQWDAWVRSEPRLAVPRFREVFVANGDWNVPDFGLPAERTTLDIEAGLRRMNPEGEGVALEAAIHETDELRTWRRSGPLWVEHAVNDASLLEFAAKGSTVLGSLRISGEARAQSVRAEDERVPYVPSANAWLEVGYEADIWRAATTLLGVEGREDEAGVEFGSYLRWDLEGAVKVRTPGFIFSDTVEILARFENLTGVEDRRWPGIPGYDRGVFLGVRTLYGTPPVM